MTKLTMEDLIFLRDGINTLIENGENSKFSSLDEVFSPNNEDSLIVTEIGTRAKADLPTARSIKAVIRRRRLRGKFFAADLLVDPCWEMLLDLTLAEVEGRQVSISSLCLASGIPPVTALRRIGVLEEFGLVERRPDPLDKRRIFAILSPKALRSMAGYFEAIGREG